MKNGAKLIRLCNIICVVLMLALLVCQFLPFWVVGENQVSIQEHTWFPWLNEDLTDLFVDTFGRDFMLKDIVLVPFVVLFGCVLGAIFCLLKFKSAGIAWIPFFVGLVGIIGYLTVPALQMGALWPVHLVVCILITIAAAIPLTDCAIRAVRWFQVPKEA